MAVFAESMARSDARDALLERFHIRAQQMF